MGPRGSGLGSASPRPAARAQWLRAQAPPSCPQLWFPFFPPTRASPTAPGAGRKPSPDSQPEGSACPERSEESSPLLSGRIPYPRLSHPGRQEIWAAFYGGSFCASSLHSVPLPPRLCKSLPGLRRTAVSSSTVLKPRTNNAPPQSTLSRAMPLCFYRGSR